MNTAFDAELFSPARPREDGDPEANHAGVRGSWGPVFAGTSGGKDAREAARP